MSYRNGGRGRNSNYRHHRNSRPFRRGRSRFRGDANPGHRKRAKPPSPAVVTYNEEQEEALGTVRVIEPGEIDEDSCEEQEQEQEERLYRALCADNPTHALSDDDRPKEDTVRRWGAENLVKTDDAAATMWFQHGCCRRCKAIASNGEAIVSELKRIYRPGETSVTVRDVFYTYDNAGYRGDFRGKVRRMDISRVTADGGDTKVTAVIWVEIFRNGYAGDSRSFTTRGMYPHEETPGRTVKWEKPNMYAVVHDEHAVTVNPRCITSRIRDVFPGVKCKTWCQKDSRGRCETHTLRPPTRLPDPM